MNPAKLAKLSSFWVSGIKKDDKGGVELKFHDRFKALELLLQLNEKEKSENGLEDFIAALSNSAVDKDDNNEN